MVVKLAEYYISNFHCLWSLRPRTLLIIFNMLKKEDGYLKLANRIPGNGEDEDRAGL
jgi:hypothetical protein